MESMSRGLVAIGVAVFAGLVAVVGGSAAMPPTGGRLVGVTQISFGCPGPVREGAPGCNPWHVFPNSRVSIAPVSVGGTPVPGASRVIVSGGDGRFRVRLSAGRYLVLPLPQAHTRGGTTVKVRVQTGKTTHVLVRFEGFPRMM
jgi:hypothetical protein